MKSAIEKSRGKRRIPEKEYLCISEQYCNFVCRIAVIITVSALLRSFFGIPHLAADTLSQRQAAGAVEAGGVDRVKSSGKDTSGSSLAPTGVDPPPVMRIADDFVEQAITQIRAGKPRAALELSEKGLAQNPDSSINCC